MSAERKPARLQVRPPSASADRALGAGSGVVTTTPRERILESLELGRRDLQITWRARDGRVGKPRAR